MKSTTAYAPVETVREDKESSTSKDKRNCSAASRLGDGWILEIACAITGSVLIVVLCVVLRVYDGQPAPKFGAVFGGSLTLNTIVSIISGAAKILLVLSVAECVGQLMWIWFTHDQRKLSDFATFDRAARGGIWGGLELLWMTKMKSLASVGAFITIFAVAIDPLSQQLLASRVEQRGNPYVNASVPTADTYHEIGTNLDTFFLSGQEAKNLLALGVSPEDYSYISTGMSTAVRLGLYSGNNEILDVPASCPGGNCTFDDFSSLAICASYADVSDHFYLKNVSTHHATRPFDNQVHLTPTHYIDFGDAGSSSTMMNATSVATSFWEDEKHPVRTSFLDFNQSLAFQNIDSPIADLFYIALNYTPPAQAVDVDGNPLPGNTAPKTFPPDNYANHTGVTYTAIEVVLEWCVQTFTISVVNGTSTTQRLQSHRNFTRDNMGLSLDNLPGGDPMKGWSIDGRHHASLQWFLKQALVGTVALSSIQKYASSDIAQILYQPFDVENATPQVQGNSSKSLQGTGRPGLEFIFDNIATSMTNYIRRLSDSVAPDDENYDETHAIGTSFYQLTVVHVRWPWITAHAVFALFSIGLLGATILCHRMSPLKGQEPWKSSGSAILHALESELQEDLKGIVKLSAMHERDEGVVVRLMRSDEGWSLVAVSKEEQESEST